MNKTDIVIWYRVYLPTGGDTDIMMKPFEYRSFSEWQDELQGQLDGLGFVDFDIVDYDYLSSGEAWGMFQDENVWDAWNDFFDLSKEYGIKPDTLLQAVRELGYDIEQTKDVLENSYEGEYDSVLDFAYYIVDEVELSDDQYETYFDWDGFGYALDVNGDVWSLTMDDWEDRYESEMEANAVYEEISSMRNSEIAEWYVNDLIGDISELGKDTIKQFFDFKKFARDLEMEGYTEIGGFVWRPY